MKKVLLSLTVCVGLFAGNSTVPKDENLRVNTSDITYRYNHETKKCGTVSFNYKTETIKMLRNGNANVDEKFVFDAGTVRYIGYVMDGLEYDMHVMDTYGACRIFEDIVIKKMENVDVKKYINVKEK